MGINAPYYPIVYVRGYAATMNEIEDTVATPYMGFNLGATKIRQDYEAKIQPFIFESPLIRLMKDEGYCDTYRNGKFIPDSESVPSKSVWIFRYYEPVSEDLGDGERRTIPYFASQLRWFILGIRNQVCGSDHSARQSFKVHLVAHSMGGLICRCYLQNICRNGVRDASESGISDSDLAARDVDLELNDLPADPLVDKVFTYATPHNGIDMAGWNVPDLGSLDRLHVRNFNRKHMREYLALRGQNSGRVDSLDGAFPVDRFFCLVGTNHRDYEAFYGLSKKATGPMSDGLVMMRNATVAGAPRAFVHRSHSGHYGIVNSEEGYQNLRRFLFGDISLTVTLVVDDISLPEAILKAANGDEEKVKAAYNIETTAMVRGLNVRLTERMVDQESAIRRTYEELVKEGKPVYLFSGSLTKSAKSPRSHDTALLFAVDLRMQVPVYEIDREFWLDEHLEGGYVLRDIVTFEVRLGGDGTTVRYGLESASGLGVAPHLLDPEPQSDGSNRYEVLVGFTGDGDLPQPAMRGRLIVVASHTL